MNNTLPFRWLQMTTSQIASVECGRNRGSLECKGFGNFQNFKKKRKFGIPRSFFRNQYFLLVIMPLTVKSICTFVVRTVVVVVLFEEVCVGTLYGFAIILHENNENTKIKTNMKNIPYWSPVPSITAFDHWQSLHMSIWWTAIQPRSVSFQSALSLRLHKSTWRFSPMKSENFFLRI